MNLYRKLTLALVLALIMFSILVIVLPKIRLEHKPYEEERTYTFWEPPQGDIDINLSKLRIRNEMQVCNLSLYSDCGPKHPCCYPPECRQAKNNPENCDCMYMVECYNG